MVEVPRPPPTAERQREIDRANGAWNALAGSHVGKEIRQPPLTSMKKVRGPRTEMWNRPVRKIGTRTSDEKYERFPKRDTNGRFIRMNATELFKPKK